VRTGCAWDPSEGADRATAIQRFLAQFSEADRAAALHLVLQALRFRVEPDRVLACELAWEVHTRAYWSQLKGEDGRPYESEEDYFRTVLGLASWRTAYKRLAIGRMLTAFPEPERGPVRAAIAGVGVAKASVIVPAIERTRQWQVWVDWARQLSYPVLQARVSEALQATPRGREPEPPGERFRRTVLAAMPDIEAMEVVERFFELGATVVGTHHPVGIFLAGCRECLAEWEVQVASGRRRQPVAAAEASTDLDYSLCDDRDVEGPLSLPAVAVCPRGQRCGEEVLR
jgi:hypothetical protein